MPRGMDERFEDPSEEAEDKVTAADEQSNPQEAAGTANTESTTEESEPADDEPLNIREDWDSATIYIEPKQGEDIEVTFARLKKQLKRENVTLEKNKHFYRGIFEVAFGEHREETKEKIRELAKENVDQ
jgi:ribosomal protein S21